MNEIAELLRKTGTDPENLSAKIGSMLIESRHSWLGPSHRWLKCVGFLTHFACPWWT